MGIFERYLSVWVGLCIVAGVGLGVLAPELFAMAARAQFAQVNVIVAVLIWVMIYPMMIQIDFGALRKAGDRPKGLALTLVINWLIKPFTMAALGWLFFRVVFADWVEPANATEYIAGMILLGVAPCTAMVFVWRQLTRGEPAYTLAGRGERRHYDLRVCSDCATQLPVAASSYSCARNLSAAAMGQLCNITYTKTWDCKC